jgi:hypothetical protein
MSATLFVAVMIWLLCSKPASALDNAFQWWQPVYINFPLGNEKIRGYLETNPRTNDNLQGMSQFFIRSALGYRLRPNVEVFGGYVWVNNYQPNYFQEQRVYQQFSVGHVLRKRTQVLHRLRTEQRFIEHRPGVSNRLRYGLRLAHPLGHTRNYLVGSNELFVNVNSLKDGPDAGIDQNRLMLGLGRQFNKHTRAEVGYQFQYVNLSDRADDRASHQLITQMYLNW